MDKKQIKTLLKKYGRFLACLRYILVYGILVFVVKNSVMFDAELTKGGWDFIFIVLVLLYRFLSIAVVPAIIVKMLFDIKWNVLKNK